MNVFYIHMSTAFKRNQPPKLTKTIETNITSEKGDEKSSNMTNTLNPNNFLSKIDKYSLYLHQYQKYFNKKLVIKYNILPNEYNLMNIENFICAKYCHNLATFKEMLLFNYEEEFLNHFFPRKISLKKIPLFADFYKSYLKFFCFPTLAELNLNDLIEDMVEKKAKAFYNENYKEESEIDKSQKKINVVIFTNKIRKDISRVNSLSNLTKTSIKYNGGMTNKSSRSLVTIEKLFNELNYEEDKKKKNRINKIRVKIEDKFENKNKNSKINSINNSINQNFGIKKSLLLTKTISKSKYEELNSKSNKFKKYSSCSNRKLNKIKLHKLNKNIQNKLFENKPTKSNEKNKNYSTLKLEPFIKIYTQYNTDNNSKNNKQITQYSDNRNNTKRNSLEKGNNTKQKLNKISIIKEIKSLSKNIISNKSNTNIKNIIISNVQYKNNTNNTNKTNKTNNNYLKTNCNKQCNMNLKNTKTISKINQNSSRNIQRKTIKIIKKPSNQQINKKKSRNYKVMVNEENTIFKTINRDIRNNTIIETLPNFYFKTKENMNNFSKKIQTTQNSQKRIKQFIKKENKNCIKSIIPSNNNCSNRKTFNCINSKKKNRNYVITSKIKKISTSLSPSVKNLITKTQGISDCRKNKIIKQKNSIQTNTNSINFSGSKKMFKKIVNS